MAGDPPRRQRPVRGQDPEILAKKEAAAAKAKARQAEED